MIRDLILIVSGVIAGSGTTFLICKSRYKKKGIAEAESIRKAYREKYGQVTDALDAGKDVIIESGKVTGTIVSPEEAMLVKEQMAAGKPAPESMDTMRIDYSAISRKYTADKSDPVVDIIEDAVFEYIDADEFDSLMNYKCESLWWYRNGVLANTNGDVISDIERTIGMETLNKLETSGDDAIYVRNNRTKMDYEVLLSRHEYEPEE